MERDFLEKLGLEKEVVESIMGEHVKDLKIKEEEVVELKNQIEQRDKDLEGLKDSDLEDFKTKYISLEEKYKQDKLDFEQKLKDSNINHVLELNLNGKVHDLDIVKNLIDKEQLKFDESGKVSGLDEQIKTLQESKGFLFVNEDQKKEEKKPQIVNDGNPKAGEDLGEVDPFQAIMDSYGK